MTRASGADEAEDVACEIRRRLRLCDLVGAGNHLEESAQREAIPRRPRRRRCLVRRDRQPDAALAQGLQRLGHVGIRPHQLGLERNVPLAICLRHPGRQAVYRQVLRPSRERSHGILHLLCKRGVVVAAQTQRRAERHVHLPWPGHPPRWVQYAIDPLDPHRHHRHVEA